MFLVARCQCCSRVYAVNMAFAEELLHAVRTICVSVVAASAALLLLLVQVDGWHSHCRVMRLHGTACFQAEASVSCGASETISGCQGAACWQSELVPLGERAPERSSCPTECLQASVQE
jgi:hypothetical protein